jgi:hypothetical protein
MAAAVQCVASCGGSGGCQIACVSGTVGPILYGRGFHDDDDQA